MKLIFVLIAAGIVGTFQLGTLAPAMRPAPQPSYTVSDLIEFSRRNDRQQQNQQQKNQSSRPRLFKK